MPSTITVCDSARAVGRLPAVPWLRLMAGEQIDFAAEGLLDGLEGEQRAERLALLRYLAADGVPLAELRRTTASGTLMFLPAERVIGGRERYTAAEIAERGGVGADFLIAVRRAMGLPIPEPDEAVYTEADLEVGEMTHVVRAAGISDEEILELLRMLGRGLSQAAETMRALTLRLVLEPGMSEHELAQRYAEAASQLSRCWVRWSPTCSRCTCAKWPRAR